MVPKTNLGKIKFDYDFTLNFNDFILYLKS